MLKRLVFVLIIAPIAVAAIWLAVSNRQPVSVAIPPEVGGAPLFSFSTPLYMLVFGALLVGMIIGSLTTWLKQGKHRKAARTRKVEANKWHFEAEKEKERAEKLAQQVAETDSEAYGRGLPAPKRAA